MLSIFPPPSSFNLLMGRDCIVANTARPGFLINRGSWPPALQTSSSSSPYIQYSDYLKLTFRFSKSLSNFFSLLFKKKLNEALVKGNGSDIAVVVINAAQG